MEPRPLPANPCGPIAKMVQQFKLALGNRRSDTTAPGEAHRKRWLATYGARIPAEINPNAHGSVLEMLEDAMQRFADRPAFRCFGQTLTYADTDRLSRQFAAYLQGRLGVKKGDRIAVMLPNIPAFPLAMLGIVRAGAVQVNVNPLYTPRELEHQLNDAGVETIVIFSGVSATLAEIIGKTAVKQVISVGLGDGTGAALPSPPVDARLTSTSSHSPMRSRRARSSRSRRWRCAATICSSCNTPAAPPGSRRAPRCRTATSSPTPSSSRRSCRMPCAPARKSWSRRCRSITSSR